VCDLAKEEASSGGYELRIGTREEVMGLERKVGFVQDSWNG
jgi:hypothetical protein